MPRPSGRDMSVRTARVATPASLPRSTMVCASSRAESMSFMNAPDPTLTSRTRADVPSAIFFDMIDDAMSGMQSTVAVMSRSAYSFLSAGARSAPGAQTMQPTSEMICWNRSAGIDACQPGIASSLSSVPPVCPRPRPDSWGTAAPNVATRGVSGSVVLSPTPPVECLSVVGRVSPGKVRRSPEFVIASVHRTTSSRVIPLRKMAMASADICSSATTPRV